MIPFQRRHLLIDELSKSDVVSLSQLCNALGNVSESTVRRDLRVLEDDGMVEVLRGGAARLVTGSFDTPVYVRKTVHESEKERIARKAASLVQDGDTIYIDVGTTTLRMVKYLTGLTPSRFVLYVRLKIAAGLLERDGVSVSDVCYKVGFNNLSYFTRTFKDRYGVTPSEYHAGNRPVS